MIDFEEKIGYKFKNKEYLDIALTHSSYANENGGKDNERLEFLGDSVLSLIVSENLFKSLSNDNEGDLSKIRASLVCEHGLFELSKKIQLADFIKLGRGEDRTGGRQRPSVISDAFEAVLGAIFLDSNFESAKKWLLNLMKEELDAAGEQVSCDYKSMIQEKTQKGGKGKVTYAIIGESGPDHSKSFECMLYVDGKAIVSGKGKSKKDAEQMAAKSALELI